MRNRSPEYRIVQLIPQAFPVNFALAFRSMTPVRISLVNLGTLKHAIDIRILERLSSGVMTLSHGSSVGHLSNSEGDDWAYTDEQFTRVLKPVAGAHVTLGLTNCPLEGNYYLRRLPDNVAVLSLHEMADIVRHENFSVETFVRRVAYQLAVLYKAEGHVPPTGAATWTHDDIRGCLFDMCSSKSDIVFSLNKPSLCGECSNRVLKKQVDPEFLPQLAGDLKGLHKTLYFRLADWVKGHPILALVLAALFALFVNLLSSVIFEKAKNFWPWIA